MRQIDFRIGSGDRRDDRERGARDGVRIFRYLFAMHPLRGAPGLCFPGPDLWIFRLQHRLRRRWAYERLPDPVHQYYYVNQGPTYTGPGNFAPYQGYEEGALPGWGYRHHRHYWGQQLWLRPYGAPGLRLSSLRLSQLRLSPHDAPLLLIAAPKQESATPVRMPRAGVVLVQPISPSLLAPI